MEIRILLAGEPIGPFSETQVRQYLGEGLVSHSDLATYEGMEEWQSIDTVLAKLPPSSPAPKTISSDAAAPESPAPVTSAAAETVSPNSVPPESPAPAVPSPQPPSTMHNDTAQTLEQAPAPPPPDPFQALTATQKTKRKLNKIVIQPILPLEATVPTKKKAKTTKTALTIEPPRPTTSLPPVTGPLPRGKKTGKTLIRQVQLSLKDFPEKPAPPPTNVPSAVAVTPSAPSKEKPPKPPEPATEIPAIAKRKRISREFVYVCSALAFLVLLITVVVLLFVWLFLAIHHAKVPPENHFTSANAQPSPIHLETQSPDTGPKTDADYSARGFARQTKGDLDGAIADYSRALNLNPRDLQACYQRGLALQAKGNWNGAIADFNAILSLNPKNADAFSNRGFVKQAQGDMDGALADYTQALQLNPKIPVAFYNVGLIKVQKGDLDGAIDAYNHALELDPKMAIAYYNRGNAKNTEGNLEGAIADYTQALALNPKIALAYCNRGFARQSKGDPEGALADYAQAIALNPKMAIAYYNRGLIKVQQGDLDGAIADSTSAIDLDPKNGQAYCNRGLARMGKNYLDGAMSDLRKFCELSPKDSGADSARLYLWLISMKENPKGTADQELATALQNDWNSPAEEFSSKVAAFLLGHIREKDLIANAASPDTSREPGQYCKAWYFAGMKRLLAGNTATAITDFQKCLATEQKDFCEYIFAKAELQTLDQGHETAAQPAASP